MHLHLVLYFTLHMTAVCLMAICVFIYICSSAFLDLLPCNAVYCYFVLQLEEFRQWLQQQVEAQDKKDPTDEPAFIAMDVVTKWEGVQTALRKTDSKRKPKPPKPAANETASANETAAEGAAEGSEGAGAEKSEEPASEDAAGAEQQAEGDSSSEGSSSQAAEEEELPLHEEL
jgi:hypothetical protein